MTTVSSPIIEAFLKLLEFILQKSDQEIDELEKFWSLSESDEDEG